MVRLKALQRWKEVAQAAFQFHYGTIKSVSLVALLLVLLYFNSTMVRLKGPRGGCGADAWRYFNSTMVRLKAWMTSAVACSITYFNSTMVRLKEGETELLYSTSVFQFHYGTIKRPIGSPRQSRIYRISIPLWYD